MHGGGLALPLAVPFHAFKPLSYRASVSPQPGQPCSASGWVTSGMDVTDTSQGWSLSTSPGAGPATDPTGLCSDPSLFPPPGGRCWRYAGSKLEAGFPRKCSALGLPRHPDTALYFQQLRRLVLFKGPKYFVVSEEPLGVEPYYPRSLRDWAGLPPGTAGAVPHRDGSVYFFRDDQYWKFDQAKLQVVATGKWATQLAWMGCWDANSEQVLF